MKRRQTPFEVIFDLKHKCIRVKFTRLFSYFSLWQTKNAWWNRFMGIRIQIFHKFTISKIYEFSVHKQSIFNFDWLCLRFLKNPDIVNWWIGWIQDSIWLFLNQAKMWKKSCLSVGSGVKSGVNIVGGTFGIWSSISSSRKSSKSKSSGW